MKSYEEYQNILNDHLTELIPKIDQKSDTLEEAMLYSLRAGGKRLRPVLLMAACEFAGGTCQDALPYACAVEFIHTYSLIHDDLPAMDDDALRRGKPTNHIMFGEATAILAGDGLLNSAFEVMLRPMMLNFGNLTAIQQRVNAASALVKAAGVGGMVAGQISDMEAESKAVSREMLNYIHLNKTGALISGSLQAGLYLGGGTEEMHLRFAEYGEHLGLAFQITDDILDVTGTAEELGKNPGRDVDKEKVTYPSLYGMDAAKEKLAFHMEQANRSMEKYGEEAAFFLSLITRLQHRTH